MALVTFMSDFGEEDHYVAVVKASLLKVNPSLQIIDISHRINPFDIAHAAYVLKGVYREFPKGSVHLVAVDPVMKGASKLIAVKVEDHLFVGTDSGLFSLISDQPIMAAVELNTLNPVASTFRAKDILAPIAANLASGQNIHELGKPLMEIQKLIPRQVKLTKREIAGNVIRVDSYGNLITNIRKDDFEKIQEVNGGAPYEVRFGREQYQKLHSAFGDVDPGECFVFFNSDCYLQIGINKGHASDLLGLRLDAPVFINFEI